MRIGVIGSGPAGIFCAKALVERGFQVDIIDVGQELEEKTQKIVNTAAVTPPTQWSNDLRRTLSHNPTMRGKKPRKQSFGSDYIYATNNPHAAYQAHGTEIAPTFAKGGYTTAWGGAILPLPPENMKNWPFEFSALEPDYKSVLQEIPYAATPSELDRHFPLLRTPDGALPLPPQIQKMAKKQLPPHIAFGASRLAVHPPGTQNGCVSCGLCLTGCVYGSIYATSHTLQKMIDQKQITYRPYFMVQKMVENKTGITLHIKNTKTGATKTTEYDYVFLGAGAINTARIMLQSTQQFGNSLTMADSQKFIIPILAWQNTPDTLPLTYPTLPALFLDQQIDQHWAHLQISGMNNYILEKLGLDPWQTDSRKHHLLRPLINRLLVGWGGLHSDHSGKFAITLKSDQSLHVTAIPHPRQKNMVKRTARAYAKLNWKLGVFFITPAIQHMPPGAGHHYGATFPMRSTPTAPHHTNTWGQLTGWQRLSLIDSSIFPEIPATTLGLTIMANAHRIGRTINLETFNAQH